MAAAHRLLRERLQVLRPILLHRPVLLEELLGDLGRLHLQILLQLEVGDDLVLDLLRLGQLRATLRLEVLQTGFVEEQLLMEVVHLRRQVGVGLAHGVDELDPVRQVREGRGTQDPVEIGRRTRDERLDRPLVQPRQDRLVPRLRVGDPLPGLQELRRDLLQQLRLLLDLGGGLLEPRLDRLDLDLDRPHLRERGLVARLRLLHVLMGRGRGGRGRRRVPR
jgi:hypothetical protein